jgi:hypothetical protein
MKNSNISRILAPALALAACGDDAHEVDLSDASREEVNADAGSRTSNSADEDTAGGGTAFVDLLGDLLGGGGSDAGLDFGAVCGLLPQLCGSGMSAESEMDTNVRDAGRADRNPRDASPADDDSDGGDDRDAGGDQDASDDAALADAGDVDAQLADASADSALDDAGAADANAADGDGDAESEQDADPADSGEAGALDAE